METCRWLTGLRILVSAYLRINVSVSARITTCIDWLALCLGYKVNHRQGKICDRIRNVLCDMAADGSITTSVDLSTVNWCDPIRIELNLTSDNFDPRAAPFVSLDEDELETISSSATSSKEKLVAVFLHMKKRIFFGDKSTDGYCWPSLDTIVQDASVNVKISRSTVSGMIDELVGIGLLKEHITGSY